MSVINVGLGDTFETQRTKINELSAGVGDLDTLDVAGTDNLVDAVNSAATALANRSGLEKNSAGELLVNPDESLAILVSGELAIANDGVKNIHLHPNVVSPVGGLRQLQPEGLSVKHDSTLEINTTTGRVGIKDKGVTLGKHSDQVAGSVIGYSATGVATVITPSGTNQVLTSSSGGVPSFSNANGVTLLGHSGYLITGKIANNQTSATVTEVTIKSTVALTSPTNIAALPAGHQNTTSNTAAPAAWGATIFPIIDADSSFGHMWSCSEGVVVLRDSVYIMNAVMAMEDPAPGSMTEVKCGMKIFNVGSDTFITFRISSYGGHIYNQFIAKHLLIAELLRGATTPTVTYWSADGLTAIAPWEVGRLYTSGTLVKANNRLYKLVSSGSITSANGSQPDHIFHGSGVINGVKAYGDTSEWLVQVDVI